MELAKSWGLLPSKWDDLSDYDKAEIMGYESVLSMMRAYEDYLEEDKRIRAESANSLKG